MNCPLCGNTNALEDLSFGGGLRIHCEPCGGFYRISSTLHALAEGKSYDTECARTRLKKKRETGAGARPGRQRPTHRAGLMCRAKRMQFSEGCVAWGKGQRLFTEGLVWP